MITGAVVCTVIHELAVVVPVKVYVPPPFILQLLPAPIVETSFVSPGVATTSAAYAGRGAKIPSAIIPKRIMTANINTVVLSLRVILIEVPLRVKILKGFCAPTAYSILTSNF
jgi:hypothetical protein